MAGGKRLRDDVTDDDGDGDGDRRTAEKRMRRPLPSLATVFKEAMVMKSVQNFFVVFEPFLRRVIQEEIENGLLRRTAAGAPAMRIELPPPAEPSSPELKLSFHRQPSPPIFSGSKIEDADGAPLQLLLVDAATGAPVTQSPPIRIELVVLDGDFPADDAASWSSGDFQRFIVLERTGRSPLLRGDTAVTMRDGYARIPVLQFTDNSSWIRSRHFRIGARAAGTAAPVGAAVTDKFTVRDHRGELYKKHHPPALADDVWRLKNIGKDGAFHRKLSTRSINTVQDFLKLLNVDAEQLRAILGQGMTERAWEATTAHAKECVLGRKMYAFTAPQCTLYLNPVCEVIAVATASGHQFTLQSLNGRQRSYVRELTAEAYRSWATLEEIDNAAVTTGDENNHHSILITQDATIVSTTAAAGAAITGPPWYNVSQDIAFSDYPYAGGDDVDSPEEYAGPVHPNHLYRP